MKAFAPTGVEIVGTLEMIPGTAIASDFARNPDGSISVEYDGGTDVDWDGQATVTRNGKKVYVDDSGGEWTEDQLVLGADEDEGEEGP